MDKNKAAIISSKPFNFLNGVHDECIEMLSSLNFKKSFHEDGLLVCTYASLIELTGGILVLVYYDRYSSVSSVFRSLLEVYVDFENLFNDPSYIKYIYSNHHENWIRVLRNANSNPYLARIRSHEQFKAVLRRHEDALVELKRQGFSPLRAKERFKRAGMLKEYESVYHFESDGTHNSLQGFINRHAELGRDTFTLALYKKRSPDDYTLKLDTASGLLLDATEKIHRRLNSEHLKRIDALKNQLDTLRETFARQRTR